MSLKRWNKKVFGNIFHRIKELEGKLLQVELDQEQGGDVINNEAVCLARKELNEALKLEQFFWKQRANLKWFEEEDRNTRFFHTMAKHKSQRNVI